MLPQMGGLAGMFMGGYNVEERANSDGLSLINCSAAS